MRELLEAAVKAGTVPGGAWALVGPAGRANGVVGRIALDPDSPPVGTSTRYDLASLTKVLYTTRLAMELADRGNLPLNTEVESFVPGFHHRGVTVEHLLRHTSGLPAYLDLSQRCRTPEQALRAVLEAPLEHDPGSRRVYSCVGFALLHRALECCLSGPFDGETPQNPDRWAFESDMALGPFTLGSPLDDWATTPPTGPLEPWRREVEEARGVCRVNEAYVQGSVHDPLAFLLGGLSGNAGLFGTAEDVLESVEAQLWGGAVHPATVAQFTTGAVEGRYLGWDGHDGENPAFLPFSDQSFGHTGFTGTLVWVEPEPRVVVVLLTNFVHTGAPREAVRALRAGFCAAAYAAATASA